MTRVAQINAALDVPSGRALGVDSLDSIVALFHALPHVMFCVKNPDGTYAAANVAFAMRCGQARVEDVMGKRAGDFFPGVFAASYEAQDRAVLTTQRSVVNQLERITRYNGEVGWFVTTKVAIRRCGEITGVVVVSVDLHAPAHRDDALDHLAAVIDRVRNEPGRSWRVTELAGFAGISPRQLERRMQQLLGTGVKQFLLASRVEHAAMLLTTSAMRLADVAEQCGYYDQSQFTRQFRTATGLSPGRYRALATQT